VLASIKTSLRPDLYNITRVLTGIKTTFPPDIACLYPCPSSIHQPGQSSFHHGSPGRPSQMTALPLACSSSFCTDKYILTRGIWKVWGAHLTQMLMKNSTLEKNVEANLKPNNLKSLFYVVLITQTKFSNR